LEVGVATEFYKAMWQVIGPDYFQMILESIDKGTLPEGIIEGLIALLHKGGEQESLNSWRPITLLNATYKIFA
jgi:hypothetical protein